MSGQLTSQTDRLIARRTKILYKRIEPPRDIQFVNNLLTWAPPEDVSAVTHILVRIEKDGGAPDYAVAVEQNAIQLWSGNTFVLSSFNSATGNESRRVIAGADYTLGNNIDLGQVQGGIAISGLSATLSEANDFGLRFWIVTADYGTTIQDLTAVAVWVENPTDSVAYKAGQSTYIPGQANSASVAIAPPSESTEIRLYLVPITSAREYPLKTVAEFGATDSSAHGEIVLDPVPADAQGVEYAENVTAQSIGPVTTFQDSNGAIRIRFDASFTPPADPRWGGVELVAKKPGPIYRGLDRYNESPATVEAESALSQQIWRVFFRSVNKGNKVNTINETGGGAPTPFVDILVGDNLGSLDLAQALTSSVGDALGVLNNVLGVTQLGITTDLINTFAVSQAKLENAPIIDTLRIVDAAVTNAKITNLAAEKVLAGILVAGVIYTGTINANQVNAGTFNGMSLILNKNGITTTIDNIPSGGDWAGINVASNSNASRAALTTAFLSFYNSSGSLQLNMTSDTLTFWDSSGATNVLSLGDSAGNGLVTARGSGSRIDSQGGFRVNTQTAINNLAQFVGNGVNTNAGIAGVGYNIYGGAYFGQTGTFIDLVTDVRINGSVLEKKIRSFDYRGGIVTFIGTESGWTPT